MFKNKFVVLVLMGAICAVLGYYSKTPVNILILISGISLFVLSVIANLKINKSNLYILLVAGIVLYALEILGANTGVIYGDFSYNAALKPSVLGTPVVMLLVWATLVKESFFIASKSSKNLFIKFILTGVLLAGLDLVIDPGAVHMGLWSWQTNGAWYGIPVSNYVGWVILGILGAILIRKYNYKENSTAIMYAYTLGFWTVYTAIYGMYGASFIGLALVLILKEFFNKNSSIS